MSVTEDLAVQYHQQDTDYYCGAACAQMVLEECGQGLLDQANLYNDNHDHSTAESGWYTAPDGLAWTLNNLQSSKYFVLDALATEDATSRMICWTVHHYKIAPVAMVYGWQHWIVVRGYTASASPSSSIDTGYSIDGFFVNNPWPPVPMHTPPLTVPPHAVGDGCGTGGDRGVADEHISYATWQSDYMTGVPSGYWAGKFVAVCDPSPPSTGVGSQRKVEPRLKGDRIINASDATHRAIQSIDRTGLAKRPAWQFVADKAAPAEPVLVQRLDRTDEFYYIVPMGGAPHAPAAAVSIDARFGTYRQSIAVGAARQPALYLLESQSAVKMVAGKRFELPDRAGSLIAREGLYCHYPVLVWKPCRESLSPFVPFHMFTIGAHRIYVRVDGAVFTALHDQERGI